MIAVNFGDARLPPSFWSKVAPCPMSGCWLWTAVLVVGGYPRFTFGGRKTLAHRFAFVATHGAIADGLEVDHVCRVRCCVNPAHLQALSHRDNVLRGSSEIAKRAASSTCKQGHPLSGDNLELYERAPGSFMRRCRACRAGVDRRAA